MSREAASVHQIAVATALASYWGLVYAGGQFDVDFGLLDTFWYSAAPVWAGAVLPFAAGVAVGRWEILLVGLTPLVVLGALELAGHVAPWGEAGPPLTYWWETKGWWPLFW